MKKFKAVLKFLISFLEETYDFHFLNKAWFTLICCRIQFNKYITEFRLNRGNQAFLVFVYLNKVHYLQETNIIF